MTDVTVDRVSANSRDLARLHSFARVFEEEQAPALRLAYAMTGDAALAEDVVADAFAAHVSAMVERERRGPPSVRTPSSRK